MKNCLRAAAGLGRWWRFAGRAAAALSAVVLSACCQQPPERRAMPVADRGRTSRPDADSSSRAGPATIPAESTPAAAATGRAVEITPPPPTAPSPAASTTEPAAGPGASDATTRAAAPLVTESPRPAPPASQGVESSRPAAPDAGTSTTGPATRPDRAESRPTTARSFAGTLHGGKAVAGGEATGWVLAGDGATGGFEVDVSAVAADAKAMDGKHVTVTGAMKELQRPGRGKTMVLVAERIAATQAPLELNK